MKVLVVFNHPAPYKVHIFNELSKYVDLTVIFERNRESNRPAKFYSENTYNFKSIILKTGYVKKDGSISNKVRQYIKKHHSEFDFIVMNGYSHWAEITAIRYMNKNKIPFILMINGGIIHYKESKLKRKIKSKLISSASAYISPSNKSNEYLLYYGADQNKIYNYPYSNISISDILNVAPNKEEIRQKYNLPLDNKIFINASQFISRKNNLLLLKMFKNRKDTLLLVGDGPKRSSYKRFIKKNNMHNIIILPFKKKGDMFEIFKCCDVFVTLAKEDVYGHTILEAMANGTPVVASNRVNSAWEAINEGVNGYIVDILNIGQINSSLNNALNLKFENITSSVKNYTMEESGKRIAEILGKING